MSHLGDDVETRIRAKEFIETRPNGCAGQTFTFRSLFTIKNLTPPPPPPSIHDAALTPEASAGFFSRLWFVWLTPLLSLGYARPLESSDLYKLPDELASIRIANAILTSFEDRCKRAALYNKRLADGRVGPGIKGLWWSIRGIRAEQEKVWREGRGKRKASIALAMNDSVKWLFWSAGVLKVIGDTAQITSPLVVKAIITFAENSYGGHVTGTPIPPIGTGIGLCFALLILQLIASWSTQHFFYRTTACGVLLRSGLIAAIYSRALSLSPRARVQITNGRLMNHISTDVSRINTVMASFHVSWTTPIQLTICLVLLLLNLGPSALAGFALLMIAMPINTFLMKHLSFIRIKSLVWTDKRSNLLREMLGGIRVIKLFSWEIPFLNRIAEYRRMEMVYIRTLVILRACINAFVFSLPTLAAMLVFIVYSLTGRSLTAANIFSSFTLFQLIRLPLASFPTSLGQIADAATACKRLRDFFEAETLDRTLTFDRDLAVAVRVEDAGFTWDSFPPKPDDLKAISVRRDTHHKGRRPTTQPTIHHVDEASIFKLKDIDMEILRGQLVAIVGPVGAGKTSLLQGLIGEMRRISGTVSFGGSVAYCAQTAWIQNATIRENICFGQPFEEERYWKAIRDSCLEPDLEFLPSYDLTEVGEKGISLSGGQKQRVNICRAIYCNSDIMIFDDPLSALDADVATAVFSNVLKNSTAGKTRILVTHALHFLPAVDYIYAVAHGKITERGTFNSLMAAGGAFFKLMEEFGSDDRRNTRNNTEMVLDDGMHQNAGTNGGSMMQEEERNTGAIPFKVYWQYLSAGNGVVFVPIIFCSLAMKEGISIMASNWLVYWEEMKWNKPQGFYIGVYAALSVSQSLSILLTRTTFALLTYHASQGLHKRTIRRVLHAPMSFFGTTPLGRIMNRFCEDINIIDNLINDSLRTLCGTLSSTIGAIIFVSTVFPWFLLIIFFILIYCLYVASFYRASSRELKRLDANLRSSLYAHFSESLSGSATISAYGEMGRFKKKNVELVEVQNRAYWLTIANQRWLGVRVDFLGAILTFAVAISTVGARFSISPGRTGVILSYIIAVQQAFRFMVLQIARAENDMNSVERIVHYASEIEQEAPHQVDGSPASPSWPIEGRIAMNHVFMKYRPELPHVLKDLNMDIAPGEKIGIVGRTGAGKSSIMTALCRLVELSSGSIHIDGVDISKVGLEQLRRGIATISQDAFLFSGTLRSNLDPFGLYDDARLWNALNRAGFVDPQFPSPQRNNADTQMLCASFGLDTSIDDEGSNLSVGQRSLVSLARTLVSEAKILILDEATASLDYETDGKIQGTIATEFKERTVLCIAHRLRSIISYDRICVLDAGTVAEFDTPVKLFNIPDGIFRGMCDKSSISLEDILSAAKQLHRIV